MIPKEEIAIHRVLNELLKEFGSREAYIQLRDIHEWIRQDDGKAFVNDCNQRELDGLSSREFDAATAYDRRWLRNWFASIRAAVPFLARNKPAFFVIDGIEYVGFTAV